MLSKLKDTGNIIFNTLTKINVASKKKSKIRMLIATVVNTLTKTKPKRRYKANPKTPKHIAPFPSQQKIQAITKQQDYIKSEIKTLKSKIKTGVINCLTKTKCPAEQTLSPNESRRSVPHNQTAIIGILFKHDAVTFVKFTYEKERIRIYDVQSLAIDPELDLESGVDLALKSVPKDFFTKALVAVCMPFSCISNKKVQIPKLAKEDSFTLLETMVETDTTLWDYQKFGEVVKGELTQDVVNLTMVPAKKMRGLLDLFSAYGVHVDVATTDAVMMNCLSNTKCVNAVADPFLLVDFTKTHLMLYVMVGFKVTYFRSVPLGYDDILVSLVRPIRIGEKDFLFTKKDIHDLLTQENIIDTANYKGELPVDRLFFQLRPFLEKIVIECKKTIAFYSNQSHSKPLSSLVMMGDLIPIKGIADYMSKELEATVNTFHYNPQLPKKENTPLFQEQLTCAIATGVSALRDNSFNLLPAAYCHQKLVRRWRKVIGGFLCVWGLVLLGYLIFTLININTLKQQIDKDNQAIAVLMTKTGTNSVKTNLLKSEAKRLAFIQRVLSNHLPVESAMLALSQMTYNNVVLDKIDVVGSKLTIFGHCTLGEKSLVANKATVETYVTKAKKTTSLTNLTVMMVDTVNFKISGEIR